MKTGRVRKKEVRPEPPEERATDRPPPARPPSPPRGPRSSAPPPRSAPPWIPIGLGAVFLCFVIVIIVLTLRGGADEWVEVTRADGSWTTTVTRFGPQVNIVERWETDCTNDPSGVVQAGTCILKDTAVYHDTVVDDYEEYAYNIYYEETWDKVYQAQGTEFSIISLGSDDWWEGNLHHRRQEELDRDSCQYTNYTVWVDDRQDSTQEIEVYLAECEVWDHIVVEERVYEQQPWCQCGVTTLVQVGTENLQGTGAGVRWPQPLVPAGGKAEQSFQGQVTFQGDDYQYTTTTGDLDQYLDYMSGAYYIGLRDGKAVTVSRNPGK